MSVPSRITDDLWLLPEHIGKGLGRRLPIYGLDPAAEGQPPA